MSNDECRNPGPLAFVETAAELGRQVREAALDHAALSMPLRACELHRCRATCCHDGVFLSDEEAEVIESLLPRLGKYGSDRSEPFDRRVGRLKTRTVESAPGELAEGFPAHFPKTRCVFLDAEHRCVLQRLAVDEGRTPWFWKPVSCWMHPLVFTYGKDRRPLLTLGRPGKDPAAGENYPGFGCFTPCGMEAAGAPPAFQTLREELQMLGETGGRDLMAELG